MARHGQCWRLVASQHISGAMPVVRWIDARGLRLDEPFFAQTVNSLRDGERPPLECETELSALERAAGSRSVMPSGIIVHVTRCGSTLLTNALRAAEHSVVLSEPQIFGRVLGWVGSPAPYWARVGLDLVRQVSAVFAHYQGNDVSQPVILKCGAEGLFLLRAIRAALPIVPCLVLGARSGRSACFDRRTNPRSPSSSGTTRRRYPALWYTTARNPGPGAHGVLGLDYGSILLGCPYALGPPMPRPRLLSNYTRPSEGKSGNSSTYRFPWKASDP